MIHFDFIVDDADAENIMDCVHEQMCKLREDAIIVHVDSNLDEVKRKAIIKGLRDHADYFEELKKKMTNKRIEE